MACRLLASESSGSACDRCKFLSPTYFVPCRSERLLVISALPHISVGYRWWYHLPFGWALMFNWSIYLDVHVKGKYIVRIWFAPNSEALRWPCPFYFLGVLYPALHLVTIFRAQPYFTLLWLYYSQCGSSPTSWDIMKAAYALVPL